MALDKLGSSLTSAIKKLFKAGVVDEAAVKELVRDIQRALLQSDVNVQLVLEISKRIEERALNEKMPLGISRREHVIKVVYEELTRFVGDKPVPLRVEPGKKKIIMLVGIQGSGKTTHAAKLSRYFQKRGVKVGLICADTYRPGAFAQLQQLAARINIPLYGEAKAKDPVKVVREGLKQFSDKELIIVDTAGRHKEEKDLIKEMKDIEKQVKPDEVIMVIDGTIGQQALSQAKTFHEATPIGAIIVTKLDGSSRGGGALSAVAATGAPIKFIGTGEKIEDLEAFIPSRFVGRLLGMGDLETLLEKVHDAEIKVPQKKAKEIMSGNFTLTDMYEQFQAVKKMGPFGKVMKMIPGLSSANVPDDMLNSAEGGLDKWGVIIQSMTSAEKENPKLLNSSRARRIARGSGTTEKDVKELLKQYIMMRKMLKMFKRKKKLPFGLGGKGMGMGMPGGCSRQRTMDVLEKAFEMLSKHPLCDHCLGRQFALLGYSMENNVRGGALKVSLTMQANDLFNEKNAEGVKRLKVLATNGFSREAQETLKHLKKRVAKKDLEQICVLCEGKFELIDVLTQKAIDAAEGYEYITYLVGIELPIKVEEHEDEFKAAFNVGYGESIRHEFGRLFGKAIGARTGKEADYLKPEIVFVINPFIEKVRLEVNPLFVTGRYCKLARDISQSKWFCSSCRGHGCEKCGGTGKMYSESVEEFSSKPLLEATGGVESFFHASGREDIDARMLGSGRPFVIEISKPKKRFIDLKQVEAEVNADAVGKVEVSNLIFGTKDLVRKLKKGENAQKEYGLLAEFEKELSDSDLRMIEEKFSEVTIRQQTPLRVMHRRADLVRERYIYKVKVKKVSLKRALLEIRCQGGLYVKELVSGDEGRTKPNVSDLLNNRAKTLKLDVLNVIME